VLAKVAAYRAKIQAQEDARRAQEELRRINKGKTCVAIKGRKVAKGTEVYVVSNPTVDSYGNEKVLVRLPDGSMVRTNPENLRVKGYESEDLPLPLERIKEIYSRIR
jgi:hypothetical protein